MSKGPRILFLDIETAPTVAYVWGLHGENISIDQIVKPGYTISFAAKWLGEPEITHMDIWTHGKKKTLRRVYDMLNEADAVVHWNGTAFDIPTLNKEFILQGWTPPSPTYEIDLLHTARRKFRFQSNRFGFVCKELGIGTKLKHTGFDMWAECLAGSQSARDLMKRYNIHDTWLLEPVYERMKPWIVHHPNFGLYNDGEHHQCPHCGSHRLRQKGYFHAQTQSYVKFKCRACGKWSRARTTAVPKRKRKYILKGV